MVADTGRDQIERRRFAVRGTVQGVGFRPFVHRLARRHGLAGYVRNDGGDVVVEVEGPSAELAGFTDGLASEAPPRARVESVAGAPVAATGERGFRIHPSEKREGAATLPADAATCEACLRELFDPKDRRHRYPFVNCSDCGPRFTIVAEPPYDRARTTMAGFEMCSRCRAEYSDPDDRRFHAEPIACPACGPRLRLINAVGPATGPAGNDALAAAIELLAAGRTVAIKGLGGYHLACLADEERAVARLRERKRRERKPLAVMTALPERIAELGELELELLSSPAAPIVLARRRPDCGIAPSVAPGTAWLGLMRPYTPLHHLLCADLARPLVMTSGNLGYEPIATDDAEALERLDGIADAFLAHDRPIHRRCEDSVVRAGFPIRRSRGFAPAPLPLTGSRSGRLRPGAGKPERVIVAAGAELKSTFCVASGGQAHLSPHLGDLGSPAAYAAFRGDLELYLGMLGVTPGLIAHDLHPDYLSTRWAQEQDLPLVGVQHHHAHAAACLAEHGRTGPALAVVLDGTGYGDDGTLWGGEVLRFDLTSYERLAYLEPVPLPGGQRAVAEPWRMAAAYLEAAGLPVPFQRWELVHQSLTVNAPLSSGAGRLFDAASALLGLCERVSYEGEAAVELEQLAGTVPADPYPCRTEDGVIRGADLIAAAHDDLRTGREPAQIAGAIHDGLARVMAEACSGAAGDDGLPVVLSGGCFQNLRLLGETESRLRERGFEVLTHRVVPPNDGGISYGQAAVAAAGAGPCA